MEQMWISSMSPDMSDPAINPKPHEDGQASLVVDLVRCCLRSRSMSTEEGLADLMTGQFLWNVLR